MTMTDMQLKLADWILVNCEIATDPVTAATILAIPEVDRTDAEQALWLKIQNAVVNYAENGPRPDSAYITMHMEVVIRKGTTTYRGTPVLVDPLNPDKGVNVEVYYIEQIHLYLQSYGSGTNDNLQKLQQSLMKDSVLQTLRTAGLVFLYDSGITDIHIPIDKTYEDRWAYDLVFSVGQKFNDVTTFIETVPYTPTILPPQ